MLQVRRVVFGLICVELERSFEYNILAIHGWGLGQDGMKLRYFGTQVIQYCGGYLMAKGKIKSAGVLFVCWTGLTAVVCVPSFIAGISCMESGEPTASLNASAPRIESDFVSLSNAAAPDQTRQPGPLQTAEILGGDDDAKGNQLDTSVHTHRETWNVASSTSM